MLVHRQVEERLVSPHEHTAEIDYTHLEADSARPWTDDVRTHFGQLSTCPSQGYRDVARPQ